ncbi:MAG: hypothetical protein HW421_4046 [Ignavibacteria bacterium]|nr:hypothetical protein [Ignavibacteria bacterium]
MELLISQKNAIFEIIENLGLSPAQFDIKFIPSLRRIVPNATKIEYKNSPYFFLFDTNISITQHFAEFCPGNESFIQKEFPGKWDYQIGFFNVWLKNLIREISQEDKWQRLQNEIIKIDFDFKADNNKFSFNEYQVLCGKLDLFLDKMNLLEIEESDLNLLMQNIEHLKDIAKDISKIDWKNLFIGSIVSIIIQLSLSQETGKLIWQICKEVFNNYLLQ